MSVARQQGRVGEARRVSVGEAALEGLGWMFGRFGGSEGYAPLRGH